MKAEDIIDKIQEKCVYDDELECIIVKKDKRGSVVCADIQDKSKDMLGVLKMFGSK